MELPMPLKNSHAGRLPKSRLMFKTRNIYLSAAICSLMENRLRGLKPAVYVLDAECFPNRLTMLNHIRSVVYLTPDICMLIIDDLSQKAFAQKSYSWLVSPEATLKDWEGHANTMIKGEPNADEIIALYTNLSEMCFYEPVQLSIIRMVCRGISVHVIAERFNLSTCTIYARLRRAANYFGKRSLSQLIAYLKSEQELITVIQPHTASTLRFKKRPGS